MSTDPNTSHMPAFDLADRLRKALRVSDVSVQDMADYLEVGRNTIGRYINGHTQPSGAVVRLWALRTGVPYGWLRDGEQMSPRPGDPGGGNVLPRLDSNQQPSGYADGQVIAGPWGQLEDAA